MITPLDSLADYTTVQRRRDLHSLSSPPFSCLPLLFCCPVLSLSLPCSLSLPFLNTHQNSKTKTKLNTGLDFLEQTGSTYWFLQEFHVSESRSVMCNSLRPLRLYSPWNSPGQNTRVGSLFPSPGDLPNPGIKPRSPALQADSLPSELSGTP